MLCSPSLCAPLDYPLPRFFFRSKDEVRLAMRRAFEGGIEGSVGPTNEVQPYLGEYGAARRRVGMPRAARAAGCLRTPSPTSASRCHDSACYVFAGRAQEDLNPLRAHELLSAIPAEDLDLLWLDADCGR